MSDHDGIDLVEFPAASPEELKAVTRFFGDVFGWRFAEYGDSYSDTRDSGVTVGVNGSDSKEQSAPLAVLHTDDLEATRKRVLDAGGTVTHHISAFPGGRRLAFTDPAGN